MIDALFGAMLTLLDVVFFILAFSLLAIAVLFAGVSFYVIRAFNRSESLIGKEDLTRDWD